MLALTPSLDWLRMQVEISFLSFPFGKKSPYTITLSRIFAWIKSKHISTHKTVSYTRKRGRVKKKIWSLDNGPSHVELSNLERLKWAHYRVLNQWYIIYSVGNRVDRLSGLDWEMATRWKNFLTFSMFWFLTNQGSANTIYGEEHLQCWYWIWKFLPMALCI